MKPHRFHRAAEAEFLEAVRHYAEKSPDLGFRFYIAIQELIDEVRESPQRSASFNRRAAGIFACPSLTR